MADTGASIIGSGDRWPDVHRIENGQPVSEETFSQPLSSLTYRTDALRRAVKALGGRQSVVVSVEFDDGEDISVGTAVCINPETGRYRRAVASMSLYDAYTASEKAFAVGLVTQVSDGGKGGFVCLYGVFDMSSVKASAFTSDDPPDSGQYYLSSELAGKATKLPNGPRVLLAYVAANPQKAMSNTPFSYAIVNPQHMDIEAHAHRTYRLAARPAGDVLYPDVDIFDAYGSNDEPDMESTGRVAGYRTQDEIDSGTKIENVPYMAVRGAWMSKKPAEYEITAKSSTWPCRIEWTKVGGTESGAWNLRCFGDTAPIGSLGLEVSLEPASDMEYGSPGDVVGRKWRISNSMGEGWRDASDTFLSENDAGALVAVSGVSDRGDGTVVVDVPANIVDLTAEAGTSMSGSFSFLEGGDSKFSFSYSYGYDGDDKYTIPYAGSVYHTLVALAIKYASDLFDLGIVVTYSDGNEEAGLYSKVVAGLPAGIAVEFNGTAVSPVQNGNGAYAIVTRKGDPESLAIPVRRNNDAMDGLPIVGVGAAYAPIQLEDGTSMAVVPTQGTGGGSLAAGVTSVKFASAPPGSVYRYAIEFDNDLNMHFPPVPAKSGSLVLNGVEMESVDMFGVNGAYEIGPDSLYWRDARYSRQPWPAGCMSGLDEVEPEDDKRLVFHFVSCFHSETGPVTSLRPAKGSPIRVMQCGTSEDAVVGDLELDVDLTIDVSDENVQGHNVVKASRNGRLLMGPVVERLVAGPGISIMSKPSGLDGQGVVTVSADGAEYSGDFETVAFENAKIASVGMFPYTRLLEWRQGSSSNVKSGFVAKFHVPATAADSVYRVKFYATVFGEESYERSSGMRNAGVSIDYSILPDYNPMFGGLVETANLKSGVWTPERQITVGIPLGYAGDDGTYGYTAYDPMLIHNDPLLEDEVGKSSMVMEYLIPDPDLHQALLQSNAVKAPDFGVMRGYTVAIRFTRCANPDGMAYTGRIGFLNLRWSLEPVDGTGNAGEAIVESLVNRTVRNLRRVALRNTSMDSTYDIKNVVSRIVAALRE